jgi:hypothetical protein
MSDILIRNVPAELKRQIEERARANKRSLSREIEALLQRSLSLSKASEYGLGTELSQLVPNDYWTDDFIVPRDNTERQMPDFE